MASEPTPQTPANPHSQMGLLKTRRFAPFFVTQFLGAFNDNLYKNALVVLLTFHAASWTTLAPEVLTNLAGGIFILPFFLFSATSGQLADKYDKALLARISKILEIVIMGVAVLGFYLHSLAVLLTALCLLGLQSTIFGPVKYAILPQHLVEDELVGGNALVESGTFVAILIGTLAGGLLAGSVAHPAWIAVGGFVVALAGWTLYLIQMDATVFNDPEASEMQKWTTWVGVPLAGLLLVLLSQWGLTAFATSRGEAKAEARNSAAQHNAASLAGQDPRHYVLEIGRAHV